MTHVLRSVAAHLNQDIRNKTSHCVRIGCDTTLLELGLSPMQVNNHCDWVVNSTAWSLYNRPGQTLVESDVRFYFGALPGGLRALYLARNYQPTA